MDNKEYKLLLKKYWSGQASLSEEERVRMFVINNPTQVDDDTYQYFISLEESSEMKLSDSFDTEFWEKAQGKRSGEARVFMLRHFLRYAAIGIVVVSIGAVAWSLLNPDTVEVQSHTLTAEDTYTDPEKAFEETKKALMFASEELNKGKNEVKEIKRFHETKMSIMGVTPTTKENNENK